VTHSSIYVNLLFLPPPPQPLSIVCIYILAQQDIYITFIRQFAVDCDAHINKQGENCTLAGVVIIDMESIFDTVEPVYDRVAFHVTKTGIIIISLK
jgi:hypothetical protein